MKRLHVNLTVASIPEGVRFYTALFEAAPVVLKQSNAACCYAKSDKYWIADPTAPEFQSLCPASAICMTKSLPSVGVGVSHE